MHVWWQRDVIQRRHPQTHPTEFLEVFVQNQVLQLAALEECADADLLQRKRSSERFEPRFPKRPEPYFLQSRISIKGNRFQVLAHSERVRVDHFQRARKPDVFQAATSEDAPGQEILLSGFAIVTLETCAEVDAFQKGAPRKGIFTDFLE